MLHVILMVIRKKTYTEYTQEGNEKWFKTCHYINSTKYKGRQWGGKWFFFKKKRVLSNKINNKMMGCLASSVGGRCNSWSQGSSSMLGIEIT